jgi:hypothetical protein
MVAGWIAGSEPVLGPAFGRTRGPGDDKEKILCVSVPLW